jgi:hypothetical protein
VLLKAGDHSTLRFAHVLAELLHVVPAPSLVIAAAGTTIAIISTMRCFMTFLPELEAVL